MLSHHETNRFFFLFFLFLRSTRDRIFKAITVLNKIKQSNILARILFFEKKIEKQEG